MKTYIYLLALLFASNQLFAKGIDSKFFGQYELVSVEHFSCPLLLEFESLGKKELLFSLHRDVGVTVEKIKLGTKRALKRKFETKYKNYLLSKITTKYFNRIIWVNHSVKERVTETFQVTGDNLTYKFHTTLPLKSSYECSYKRVPPVDIPTDEDNDDSFDRKESEDFLINNRHNILNTLDFNFFFKDFYHTSNEPSLQTIIKQNVEDCGVHFLGPNCLDFNRDSSTIPQIIRKTVGFRHLLTTIQIPGITYTVVQLIKIHAKDDRVHIDDVEYYLHREKDWSDEDIHQEMYLLKDFIPLFKAYDVVSTSSPYPYMEEIEEVDTYKKFFHYLTTILDLSNWNKKIKIGLNEVISKKTSIIRKIESPEYQIAFLELLHKTESPELENIALSYLANSDTEQTKKEASYYLAKTGRYSPVIEKNLMDILKDGPEKLQAEALDLLVRLKKSFHIEQFVIENMEHISSAVRTRAFEHVLDMDLTPDHLRLLTNILLNSELADSRRMASEVFKTVPVINDTTPALIKALLDDSIYVRANILDILKRHDFTHEFLHDLKLVFLESTNVPLKNFLLKKIADMNSVGSTTVLIETLKDTDYDIRSHAMKLLNDKTLIEEHIGVLAEILESKFWPSRRAAAIFLGNIISKTSLRILQTKILTETRWEVRGQMKVSIEKITKILNKK